jgi:hypothetical protein
MTKSSPVVPRLLTLCVSLSALLPASHVHGDTTPILGVTPTQYCERWRDNALLGARQQLRGATREVQYIDLSTFVEMIEHGIDRTKVFVMAGQYTRTERQFLEESALAGYDRMAAFRAEHPDEVANYEKWQRDFYEECLDSSRRTSRATQGEGLTPAIKE